VLERYPISPELREIVRRAAGPGDIEKSERNKLYSPLAKLAV